MVMDSNLNEITDIVRSATAKVFSTMLGTDVGAATEEEASAFPPGGEIAAIIGLAGAWTGSGTIRCSTPLACLLSGRLLMTEFAEANDEVFDAMGEIANMVIGNFKDDAAHLLGSLGMSTPTVIHGNDFHTRNVHGQNGAVIAFQCEGEIFEVRLCLAQATAAKEARYEESMAIV